MSTATFPLLNLPFVILVPLKPVLHMLDEPRVVWLANANRIRRIRHDARPAKAGCYGQSKIMLAKMTRGASENTIAIHIRSREPRGFISPSPSAPALQAGESGWALLAFRASGHS